ncbi:MAG: S-layer homology domain-containing protein [Defluviitaleaceae bacterium]|nr:S-layer homology domain-containing protein [Defluviitaleaceae bacterium]
MKNVKKTLLGALAIFSINTITYATPVLTEPETGPLDLTGQNAPQNANEWAEAHRQFLNSISDWQNQQTQANPPTQSQTQQPTNENRPVQSVTGQLTQNQSIITDITNMNTENLMLYMHDQGYLHLFSGEARPNMRVTRGDFAYMLGSFVRTNSALLNRNGFTTSRRNNVNFSDITNSHFAYENLIELARRRIVHETGRNIRPNEYITREEAYRWIHNLLYLMDNSTPRERTTNPRLNLTRIEAAEIITQLELLLNGGPVITSQGLNLIRANARNFTQDGFELHLTINNTSVWRGANVHFRINDYQRTVPLNNLTPIAVFAHNSVYSVFVPAEFPGTHSTFVNLTLGNENSAVRIVNASAVAGPANLTNQATISVGGLPNWQAGTANNWGWNNENRWNTNWSWQDNNWSWENNNWNNNWNWQWENNNWRWVNNNTNDQWSQPTHQFPGWNMPEGNQNNNNWGNQNNIIFGDPIIEQEVRRQLNRPQGNITAADARTITDINITIPTNHGVSSRALMGLQHFTNLQALRFSFIGTNMAASNLRNLRDIEGLTDLRRLELRGHGINNLSHINNLRRLEVLDLSMADQTITNNLNYINYLNGNHSLTTWR